MALSVTCLGASASTDKPGEGVKITPSFPSVDDERFRGEIAMQGLRELGYNVQKPKETEYATMILAVGYGDADFSVNLWDKLHASFYEKAGGDQNMVKAGDIMPGVLQGYLIDKKTADQYNIKYITDLKKPELAKLFDTDGDGKADLTGCNPGWGCEPGVVFRLDGRHHHPLQGRQTGALLHLGTSVGGRGDGGGARCGVAASAQHRLAGRRQQRRYHVRGQEPGLCGGQGRSGT
jgi:ABC-type proline/glycine betaine transport system substrate-binding protein